MEKNPGENASSAQNAEAKAKNAKLRAMLDGLDLTPEQTRDDIAPPSNDSNRDSEILRDVPPHHG